MPGILKHAPVGSDLEQNEWEGTGIHTVNGASGCEFLITTDVQSSPASGSSLPISSGYIHEHEQVEYPMAGEEVYTSAEKTKLAGLSEVPSDCFSLIAHCYTVVSPTASVYYWGGLFSGPPQTVEGRCKIYIPRSSTSWIRSVYIPIYVMTATGTSELSSMYLRVTRAGIGTTDYLVSDQVQCNDWTQLVYQTGLNIEVQGGDYFEFKWVPPSWSTPPQDVRFSATLWLDALGSAVSPLQVNTYGVTAVGDTTATLKGNLVALGGNPSVDVNFEWGTTTGYGSSSTPAAVTALGIYSQQATGLSSSTLYHFRAKASAGGSTVYGSDLEFTTSSGTPPPPDYYGTDAYTESDPIGGGFGCSGIYASGGSYTYRVSSASGFLAALGSAASGNTIFIEPWATIDLSGATHGSNFDIQVPAGVIICSNRGETTGSPGGRIYTATTTISSSPPHYSQYRPLFELVNPNVTFSGVRIEGPESGTSATSRMTGIRNSGTYGIRVYNCEISNFPYAGVGNLSDGAAGTGGADFATVDWNKAMEVRCSYIHHCRQTGFGYGIQVAEASLYAKANHFNAGRHFISGERDGGWEPYQSPTGSLSPTPTNGKETYMKIHFNVFGYGTAECTNTQVDQHGGSDTAIDSYGPFPSYNGQWSVWAGGEVEVKWNDFLVVGQACTSIRGIPRFSWEISWNWFKGWSEANQYSACRQRLYDDGNKLIPEVTAKPGSGGATYQTNPGEIVNVHDNWWSSTAPPP